MKQYLDLCTKVIDHGVWKENRTGIRTKGIIGAHMRFDLSEGFPVVTTKRFAFKTCVAEMLGFLRGYDSAEQFRDLGCQVWDDNANKNEQWLANPNRRGKDHLGRIYGVQARRWLSHDTMGYRTEIDQLRAVYDDLRAGRDNRREIVTHWNPAEMDRMALPPCHLLYQFGIQGNTLCLSMYQRSCDMALGVPFNITGYAWLLATMAKVTRLRPGVFNHFLHDVHLYENQIDLMREQITRAPSSLPELMIDPEIQTLDDLEQWVKPSHFHLENYNSHDAIAYPFAV